LWTPNRRLSLFRPSLSHFYRKLKNKNHSGWKDLFCEQWKTSNRERIFNLVFKFYILAQGTALETINGFEELLLLHSTNLGKSKDALFVWGQNVYVNYNYHNILTLTLSRKSRRFLPKDEYRTVDGEEMGELLVYKDKEYYFERDLDARRKNSILFMQFERDNEDFAKFKKTQVYYYQSLMNQLEIFLDECGITYQVSDFQTDHYLENSFLSRIPSVTRLEVINNIGVDLTESDKLLLQNFLKHEGISDLTFYNGGKTISSYQQIESENEEDSYWNIEEVTPWTEIELDSRKNYLVFNRLLEEEAGSMAYQGEDGYWYPSIRLEGKVKVDFYSQLKRRVNYLDTGEFVAIQGINVSEFRTIGNTKSSGTILNYEEQKVDEDVLHSDVQPFTDGKFLDVNDAIVHYLIGQQDSEQWERFCVKHKIKVSPEFQKVLIELGIKSWIKEGLGNSVLGLPIVAQSLSEKRFTAVYVRSSRHEKDKAVAVELLHKESCIYILSTERDMQEIKRRFPFLRKRSGSSERLVNQQYFVDEESKTYISCYTDDFFTPTLIGRHGILDDIQSKNFKVDRKISGQDSSRLLPLVMYYNSDVKPINRIRHMVCFDLRNPGFIQYYVPPGKNLDRKIKTGFRVYHLLGKTYDNQIIPTSELIMHPIVALHFSTLTQNILRLSDNSQSSLLQKVAKVLIDN
jgi:hypothetical protein